MTKFIFIILFPILTTSCISLSTVQTGKVTPKGDVDASIGIGSTEYPYSSKKAIEPGIDFNSRFGVYNNLDIGFKASTFPILDIKYQFIGNENSKFALSTGFGYIFGLNAYLLPLYFSYHPSDRLAIYLSPRTINEYNFHFNNISNDLNGFSTGFKFGKRNSIILEYSLYKETGSTPKIINQLMIGFVIRRHLQNKN
jgi:hypothetical protein